MSNSGDQNPSRAGVIALAISILLCSAAHILLRSGAIDLSATQPLSNWRLIAGLAVYGSGTLLWLYCLSKLDLSVAFPASALQFILVLGGARWILGEHISLIQMIGVTVILAGIGLLFFERRKPHGV